MRLGAYQFAVTGSIDDNMNHIRLAVQQASFRGVGLLILPECALTGYPPLHVARPAAVNWEALARAEEELSLLAIRYGMHLVAGTIRREGNDCFNSAILCTPTGGRADYHKRALWGWDAEHFRPGALPGVWDIAGYRIGVRICYEVRFPEYFRELYKSRTDLNLLLFCDVADRPDPSRYDLIRAHVLTRAVENVCPILTVNAAKPFQTAPTGFYGASGQPLGELTPGQDALLVADWLPGPLSFGEEGRRAFSDRLVK